VDNLRCLADYSDITRQDAIFKFVNITNTRY
jgi:hypothetical protein